MALFPSPELRVPGTTEHRHRSVLHLRHTAPHIMNSLRDGSLSESASVSYPTPRPLVFHVHGYGSRCTRHVSSNSVMTWRPLLSTGSLGGFPRLNDTMGCSDFPPSISTRSKFFTSRYHRVARGLLPSVVGVPTGGQGVVGSGLPIWNERWKRPGLSGSLEALLVIVRALLIDDNYISL